MITGISQVRARTIRSSTHPRRTRSRARRERRRGDPPRDDGGDGRPTSTTTTTTETFEGKYSQFVSDDIETAAIRKSGIDPNRVVGTPGTTSAMLASAGRCRLRVSIRDESSQRAVRHPRRSHRRFHRVCLSKKRSQPTLNDPRLNVKEPLSEQFIMSMKTDDFLSLLHDYGDEAGYTEVATLKRALAIAITTKGALSSSDSEY